MELVINVSRLCGMWNDKLKNKDPLHRLSCHCALVVDTHLQLLFLVLCPRQMFPVVHFCTITKLNAATATRLLTLPIRIVLGLAESLPPSIESSFQPTAAFVGISLCEIELCARVFARRLLWENTVASGALGTVIKVNTQCDIIRWPNLPPTYLNDKIRCAIELAMAEDRRRRGVIDHDAFNQPGLQTGNFVRSPFVPDDHNLIG